MSDPTYTKGKVTLGGSTGRSEYSIVAKASWLSAMMSGNFSDITASQEVSIRKIGAQ
jgi:hypothetical protein